MKTEINTELHNIKLAALDLDGTVLTNDKRVTQRTRKAVENAAARGQEIVFVTGRPFFGIPKEIMSVKGVRYFITSNGSVVTEVPSASEGCDPAGSSSEPIPASAALSGSSADTARIGRVIYSELLDRSTAEDIIENVLSRKLPYSVYTGGLGYCEQPGFEMRMVHYEGTPIGEYIRQSVRVTENIIEHIRNAAAAPENIWVQEKDTVSRDRLDELIRRTWNVRTVLTSPTDIEIGSYRAGKGKALAWLRERLRIPKSEILAMGDNFNDLDMFKAAGLSAAMGNSPDGVKAAADFIAPGNEEDGVAAVLERII